ncbi:discoidin domain-containing protein [Leifsonia sp. ZF2019]|uniref:discoidin domain-containing protein n=1 Tax=Leifsonia sp. ZF2019 TaxID=2781978 RepID=UPI001CBA73F9|nr:discoidin domain-containing protein [Leifsonia sp. ZF2019]UAJ79254.1 discoidin domain-containing protein [Leifsonia sp. ZF2019]
MADRTRADSWIQVDLGSSQTVSNVRLAWESSAGARYTVQTSEDGTNWTTRSAYGGAPADVNVSRLDTVDLTPAGAAEPAPVTTRFVRMQGEQGDPAYGYSLYHLRALTPTGVDAAAGRPASASSADGSYPASAVTDGTATTRWAVSKADRTRADSWVQVDLGAPTAISQVQLGWESAAGRQYRVQTSLDGVTWQDAAAFRYTGDQILSSSGDWLDVEGKAGFVVRGSTAPITVSREGDATNVVRLADGTAGARLIEMLPADAAVTRARAAAAEPTTDAPGVLVSSLGGYLTAFNLTGADVKTTVVVPYTGAAVPLYAGTQQLGAQASTLAITLPAATAVVLAPRATVPTASAATGTLTATLPDARTVELTGSPATVDVTNVETGETRAATIAAPAVPTAAAGLASTATPAAAGPAPNVVVFASATAYPVADLALSTFTYPASVLPAGMTSPGLAVDGDATTAWVPGPGGRMVTDLGSVRAIGFVATAWDGAAVPDAQVAVSDDGITFTPVGTIAGGTRTGSLEVAGNARYVALTTRWRTGEAGLTALRVLPPGVAVDQPGDGTGPGGDPGEGTGPGGSTPGSSTPGGTGHGSDSAGRHDPDALSATGLSVAAGALLAALLLGAGAVLLVRRRKRTGRVH